MKITVDRAPLLLALSRAVSVVDPRDDIPILSNVLIEADGAQVSFRATDLETEIVTRASAMVEIGRAHV